MKLTIFSLTKKKRKKLKRKRKKRGVDNMAKSNSNLVRVNMNLPKNTVDKVKEYADSIGVNITNAYIFLLNQALEQKSAMAQLPLMFSMINSITSLQSIEEIKKMFNEQDLEK